MNATTRGIRRLAATLLLGIAFLAAGTQAATAATAEPRPRADATGALLAPDLFSATINEERTDIALFWTPAPGDTADFYSIYADDLLVQRLTADGPHLLLRSLLIHEELTGSETYTVIGDDGAGNESPPSNGLVPGPPGTLDPVELTSAALDEDAGTITLGWTPGQPIRDEFAPTGLGYTVLADGLAVAGTFDNTTLTFPLRDPNLLRPDLTGTETFTIVAGDLSLASSPPSNGLVPTPR